MKKLLLIVIGLVIHCSALADEEKVLNVYNWVDYIGDSTLLDFESRTGIRVVYDVFDSNDVLQGKLLAGSSGFDVVVPTSGFLARLIGANIFLPLDPTKLSNLKHMNPVIMDKVAQSDPGHRFGVPYLWGTTGIGFNRQLLEKVLGTDAPTDSWELVFNPKYLSKLSSCGVSFLDAFDEIFPAVLAYQGMDPYTMNVKVFKNSVVPVLEAVTPHVTYFHSSKYINDLANGDICIALGWSGDILQAASRAKEANMPFQIEFSSPIEGAALWVDMMAIPIDAPHPDNAHKFINFLMEPAVIADITNKVRFANANSAADALVNPEILSHPGIYPSAESSKKSYTLPPYPQKIDRQGLRLWTRIKTGR